MKMILHCVIRTAVMSHPVLFTNEITVRGREQLVSCETSSHRTTRITRTADVEVRAGAVTINAPAMWGPLKIHSFQKAKKNLIAHCEKRIIEYSYGIDCSQTVYGNTFFIARELKCRMFVVS